PALARARSAADSAVCRSNLRQLSIATANHLGQSATYPGSQSVWPGLEPFLGAKYPEVNTKVTSQGTVYLGPRNSVYACPGYNRIHGVWWSVVGPYGTVSDAWIGSYGHNMAGIGNGLQATGSPYLGLGASNENGTGTPESAVANASDML